MMKHPSSSNLRVTLLVASAILLTAGAFFVRAAVNIPLDPSPWTDAIQQIIFTKLQTSGGNTVAIEEILPISMNGETLEVPASIMIGNNDPKSGKKNQMTNSVLSTIGAGDGNTISNTQYGVIGGGESNVLTSSDYGFIAGGIGNEIRKSPNAVIAAGQSNIIDTGSDYSIIAGGLTNKITGKYSIIPGGQNNKISGSNSVAMGQSTTVNANNTFAWNDYSRDDSAVRSLTTNKDNVFLIKAQNGVLVNTTNSLTNILLNANGPIQIASETRANGACTGGNAGTIKSVSGCFCACNGVDSWYALSTGPLDSAGGSACKSACAEKTSCTPPWTGAEKGSVRHRGSIVVYATGYADFEAFTNDFTGACKATTFFCDNGDWKVNSFGSVTTNQMTPYNTYKSQHCEQLAPKACVQTGGVGEVAHGNFASFYKETSVIEPADCDSKSILCYNGDRKDGSMQILSGGKIKSEATYIYPKCTRTNAAGCTIKLKNKNGVESTYNLKHSQTIKAFLTGAVPMGQFCSYQNVVCNYTGLVYQPSSDPRVSNVQYTYSTCEPYGCTSIYPEKQCSGTHPKDIPNANSTPNTPGLKTTFSQKNCSSTPTDSSKNYPVTKSWTAVNGDAVEECTFKCKDGYEWRSQNDIEGQNMGCRPEKGMYSCLRQSTPSGKTIRELMDDGYDVTPYLFPETEFPLYAEPCSTNALEGLNSDILYTLVNSSSCNSSTKCQFKCKTGFEVYVGKCIQKGKCGSMNNQELDTLYSSSSNLCDGGTVESFSPTSNGWSWTCKTINDTNFNAYCSAKRKVAGACGSNNNGSFYNVGDLTNRCTVGSSTTPQENANNVWEWTCTGENGGDDVACTAKHKIDSVCGSLNGTSGHAMKLTSPSGLCNVGTASTGSVSYNSSALSWTCASKRGTPAYCTASTQCSSSNGWSCKNGSSCIGEVTYQASKCVVKSAFSGNNSIVSACNAKSNDNGTQTNCLAITEKTVTGTGNTASACTWTNAVPAVPGKCKLQTGSNGCNPTTRLCVSGSCNGYLPYVAAYCKGKDSSDNTTCGAISAKNSCEDKQKSIFDSTKICDWVPIQYETFGSCS